MGRVHKEHAPFSLSDYFNTIAPTRRAPSCEELAYCLLFVDFLAAVLFPGEDVKAEIFEVALFIP